MHLSNEASRASLALTRLLWQTAFTVFISFLANLRLPLKGLSVKMCFAAYQIIGVVWHWCWPWSTWSFFFNVHLYVCLNTSMFVAIITVVLFKFFCYIYTTSVCKCSIAICCQQKSDCSLSGFNIEAEERKKISFLDIPLWFKCKEDV